MVVGAIEAGGTKFVCGVGNADGVIRERVSFPTQYPEETLARVVDYFNDKDVAAIGVGSFGPIDIDENSATYGYVTTTPKPGWSGFDVLGALREYFDVPMGWDTDVNAAAFGEATWGAARGLDSCVYYTVGTGVGVGVFAEGQLVHGLVHPEGGHVIVRRHEADDADRFAGNCPYHGDCLEGLAAGPALEKRWGVKGSELAVDHPAWEIQAYYIGQAVANTILLLSPKKVILGGGVMQQKQLFPLIRGEVGKLLNRYVNRLAGDGVLDDYIVPPGLGDDAGLSGALALGVRALERASG